MSCCTNDTAKQIALDKSQLYNFNYSHCGNISQKCLSWFIKNHCFYECSPNLGPWLTKVSNSYRNERFINLPLCTATCDNWWDACKFDKTCVINWSKGFKWSKDGNVCPQNSSCELIQTLFKNSTFFCENVYGPNDYKVVSNEHCLTFDFIGKNPNTNISKEFAKAKAKDQAKTEVNTPFPPFLVTSTPVLQSVSTIVSVVLASLVLAVACCAGILFKQMIPSKQETRVANHESEMSFMGYDEDEEDEPELTGTLRMEL